MEEETGNWIELKVEITAGRINDCQDSMRGKSKTEGGGVGRKGCQGRKDMTTGLS